VKERQKLKNETEFETKFGEDERGSQTRVTRDCRDEQGTDATDKRESV
jgi:hypothetical protein